MARSGFGQRQRLGVCLRSRLSTRPAPGCWLRRLENQLCCVNVGGKSEGNRNLRAAQPIEVARCAFDSALGKSRIARIPVHRFHSLDRQRLRGSEWNTED